MSLPANCPALACSCDDSLFAYQIEPFADPPFTNTQQTAVANCPPGYTGSSQSVTVAAGTYFSYVSVADANLQALNAAQAAANLRLSCTPPVYWNTEQCAVCPLPSTEQYCVPAGTYSSTVSQADANAIALAAATANLSCGIAGQLNGLRWEIPGITLHPDGTTTCVDPADQTATLAGNPGQLYQVRLRFRGCVELRNYINGTVDASAHSYFYKPDISPVWITNNGAFQTDGIRDPADGSYNEYALHVSNPDHYYWLNRSPSGAGTCPALIDYEETIPMYAGAAVTLLARTLDNVERANVTWSLGGADGNYSQITVPAITNILPNVGQFIQMDVISIT